MSTGSIIYMILVLGIVWGGFITCLILMARGMNGEDVEENRAPPGPGATR